MVQARTSGSWAVAGHCGGDICNGETNSQIKIARGLIHGKMGEMDRLYKPTERHWYERWTFKYVMQYDVY